MEAAQLLPLLLGTAVLLPLISFFIIVLGGPRLGKNGAAASMIATFMIGSAFVLSMGAFFVWISNHPVIAVHHGHGEHHAEDEGGHQKHDTEKDAHNKDHDGDAEPKAHEGDEARTHNSLTKYVAVSNEASDDEAAEGEGENEGHATDHGEKVAYTGDWWTLGNFGKLTLGINYYIDALTVAMFCMVTLIATCIHVYASGYMHDELHDWTDHEVTLENGEHLHRPGRYHRFFQYLSLFCFSMLGLVIAGNIAMTFVFWELVGICSYFLIGFYVERKSASNAANKAFIVNRVGDFGMIIGLMTIWSCLGTFDFGDIDGKQGLFSLVRTEENHHELQVPEGMVRAGAYKEMGELVAANVAEKASDEQIEEEIKEAIPDWRDPEKSGKKGGYGYWLLVIAGVGIFCGCVGKSAQFPLHTWLPDAMEGPTPVSALVHSATMVAAGVFLVARFFPVFAPEVLLVIATSGTITLFMAATIAITATDIKRVLAYSTISQLGYMMLSLGLGGWLPGVMHLFTHAFFKSLLFMCSGSVIHAVHTNEMTEMGGLRKKMPYTAYTMLIGCIAIAGLGIPFIVGLSGYYSKDTILEQAMSFSKYNAGLGAIFFIAAAGGAAITSFYMFRLWFMTFAGEPRDKHRYDHAHESPPSMFVPLVVLSVFAIGVAWTPNLGIGAGGGGIIGAISAAIIFAGLFLTSKGTADEKKPILVGLVLSVAAIGVAALLFVANKDLSLANLVEQARPTGTMADQSAVLVNMTWPDESKSHAPEIVLVVTLLAFGTAIGGLFLAAVFYAWKKLDPDEVRTQFKGIYQFLVNKWWFDELYDFVFVRPSHWIAGWISFFDQRWIDGLIHGLASVTRSFSNFWERFADQTIVDGFVNRFASATHSAGLKLRGAQTGSLRQYVMFIAAGTVAAFVFLAAIWRAFI